MTSKIRAARFRRGTQHQLTCVAEMFQLGGHTENDCPPIPARIVSSRSKRIVSGLRRVITTDHASDVSGRAKTLFRSYDCNSRPAAGGGDLLRCRYEAQCQAHTHLIGRARRIASLLRCLRQKNNPTDMSSNGFDSRMGSDFGIPRLSMASTRPPYLLWGTGG